MSDPEGEKWLTGSGFQYLGKPCVLERNGGYFWTRGTRQTCLGDVFGQENPWSSDDRFGVVWGVRLINAWIPNWKSRIFDPTNFSSY